MRVRVPPWAQNNKAARPNYFFRKRVRMDTPHNQKTEDAMATKKKRSQTTREYIGILTDWFETGTEGLEWVLREDGKQGYEGMVIIQPGDHLTVYDADGKILFDDTIVFDTSTGRALRPGSKPKYYQQAALGYWIHWIQKGWKPDDWAALFCRGEGCPARPLHLRAKLVRRTRK